MKPGSPPIYLQSVLIISFVVFASGLVYWKRGGGESYFLTKCNKSTR